MEAKSLLFRNVVVALVIALLFVASSCNADAQDGLEKIAENVYSYVDIKNATPQQSYGANAGIIVGDDSIVVIDTLISAKEAKRFIRDIRAITDKPAKYVINTHYHLDHAFGNSEFAKIGSTIISNINSRQSLIKSGKATLENAQGYGLTEDDMAGTEINYPDLTFQDRMQIDIGNEIVELIHLKHSHTDGDTLVYLPQKKILFAGDVLFTNYHPFIAEGDIENWIKGLDFILSMDVETIIPGHGPVSGKKDVEAMKEYLSVFDKKARELTSGSDDIEYITAEMMKSLPERSELVSLITANLQMKYGVKPKVLKKQDDE